LAKETPVGRSSLREAPVRVVFALFVILMDNWLVPPDQMLLGLKLFATEGVPVPVTFRVALAGLVLLIVVPPPEAVNAPTGIVLIQFPGVVEVTLTDTVHDPGVDPRAGTVPPLNDMAAEPAGAVTVPPQVFPATFVTVTPDGKLSVQDVLVNANVFGLKTEMRRREVPPAGMEIGVKVLLISAGKDMP
jgi:hypothetical protein